jgi:hypothetical protein
MFQRCLNSDQAKVLNRTRWKLMCDFTELFGDPTNPARQKH